MTHTMDTEVRPAGPGDTQSLTLLIVEDELMSREMLSMQLEGLFGRVITAVDGNDGLRIFNEQAPDIVLTDQIMPGLSGLDLLRGIRATGAKTPVLLMTSSIDNAILLEAINCGVERFVPKPFDFNLIIRTLSGISREIINERLAVQHRLQEVELLRYRDSYNSMQQESARQKERHVVRHDLRNHILEGFEGVRWGINVAYSPHDIMCGDGYSVRNLFDGRQLIFVVDAMGSGMSASLTAMLATSFFNYQVENLHLWGAFTLRIFLNRFKEYLTSMLLTEEVLSCGFFLVDLLKEEIDVALFALPPLLIRKFDGSVQIVRGENPPIGIYPGETNISTISLSGVADVLIMTDGITDASLERGDGSYREELGADFRKSPTLTELLRRFRKKTEKSSLDDLTLMHLRRLDLGTDWSWKGEPDLSPAGLRAIIQEFLAALASEVVLDTGIRGELESTLTEALRNALEHGCLGIDREEKSRLLLSGEYDDSLGKKTPLPGAAIMLSATLWRGSENPLLLMEVSDTGIGLPLDALKSEWNITPEYGHGLRMLSQFNDSLFIGRPGGCLIILKTLPEGDEYAD
ncbi:MAG: response regulator [Desulfuromonadaceae bacterium]|nr:response regulator [Desulfuromonadaceae bacterium]